MGRTGTSMSMGTSETLCAQLKALTRNKGSNNVRTYFTILSFIRGKEALRLGLGADIVLPGPLKSEAAYITDYETVL